MHCVVMVLSLDSLGQCVSALSKRFAAAESIRDTVNCLPHSHREKHSEIRHRKDTHHQQEDTPKPKVKRTTPAGICSSVFGKRSASWLFAAAFWNVSLACNEYILTMNCVWLAVNQRQSPHLHSQEAKPQLRVRHRTQPQTERRAEGSIQGARDHSTWWENTQGSSLLWVGCSLRQIRAALWCLSTSTTSPLTECLPYFLQPSQYLHKLAGYKAMH